jgi:hypothetical protein
MFMRVFIVVYACLLLLLLLLLLLFVIVQAWLWVDWPSVSFSPVLPDTRIRVFRTMLDVYVTSLEQQRCYPSRSFRKLLYQLDGHNPSQILRSVVVSLSLSTTL